MRRVKQKISFLLILVFLVNLLLPGVGALATESTNEFVVPGGNEQNLISPDASNWGNQTSTSESNANSNSQLNSSNEEKITNEILEDVDKSNSIIETQYYQAISQAIINAATKIAQSNGWNALVRWANKYGDKASRIVTIAGIRALGPSSPYVTSDKVRYLLTDPGKYKGFNKLGYTLKNFNSLKDLAYKQGKGLGKSGWIEDKYGYKYTLARTITGPNGIKGRVTTCWQCDWGTRTPRFITGWAEPFK
ncbi:hypothetical protein Dtox_1892 [Desulfofarcimen acetoxidans DSM 771]|uniref:DUF6883 domain-containing protein n=1 Tax=Desulfofarcimen acetoxidans (strain ATCC 49208 / DSM 771 / KCTC 5769 / VKM B-1644 / 5575) TaxID=485916 RepID=C8VXT0_DESAS|nr:DUF6883 domain-containing protein [Desulfofarcimen acetoxidans]ACV62736.1 hypothetical protein Dtox_1892 [Desulfofarcimen acetoxidans DSM 771]